MRLTDALYYGGKEAVEFCCPGMIGELAKRQSLIPLGVLMSSGFPKTPRYNMLKFVVFPSIFHSTTAYSFT